MSPCCLVAFSRPTDSRLCASLSPPIDDPHGFAFPAARPLSRVTHLYRTHCAREGSTNGLRTPGPAAASPVPPAGRPKEPPLSKAGHPAAPEGGGRPDGLHHGLADPEKRPEAGGAPCVAGDRHVPRSLQVRCVWLCPFPFPTPVLSTSVHVCGTCFACVQGQSKHVLLRSVDESGLLIPMMRWRFAACRQFFCFLGR